MKKYISSDFFPLYFIAAITLLIHLFAITHYDYFRDEFYYIACSHHMDFGFVDHPPLADGILWIIRNLLGESLVAIRIVPILLSCSLVVLAGALTREFGGTRFAMVLAGLGVATAPILLGTSADYSMNVFDQLFWFLAIYFFTRFINTEKKEYLIAVGIIFGFGLLTKHLIAFLIVGMGLGLLLTEQRKYFKKKWLWISLGIAFALFLPNVLWQIGNGFPNLEFARNATLYKNTETTFIGFLTGHILEANPPQVLLIIAALWFFFITPPGKQFRIFGIAYVFVVVAFVFTNGKTYYIAPFLPVVFSAGAVHVGNIIELHRWKYLKPVLLILPILTGLVILPMAIPILPVETFIQYNNTLGIQGPKNERHEMGPLPQHYADMFGWRELAANVAKVYASLPDSEKADCAIYTTNYGRAGAIDFFGQEYGLPKSICGHNSYWLWGPGKSTGKTIIIVGGHLQDHVDDFETVYEAGQSDNPYSMPYERHIAIFVGHRLKLPIKKVWAETRHYD